MLRHEAQMKQMEQIEQIEQRYATQMEQMQATYTQYRAEDREQIRRLEHDVLIEWIHTHCEPINGVPMIRNITELKVLKSTSNLGESKYQCFVVSNVGLTVIPLPEGFRQLINLQSLNLNGCPLTSLPESLGLLQALQMLYLDGCTSLTSLLF